MNRKQSYDGEVHYDDQHGELTSGYNGEREENYGEEWKIVQALVDLLWLPAVEAGLQRGHSVCYESKVFFEPPQTAD